MKKRLLVLGMTLCCVSVYAQSIIPKIGISVTSLATSHKRINATNMTGIVGGIGVDIPLKGILSIQPEVLFHQKGFTGDAVHTVDYGSGNVFEMTVHEIYRLNYLELQIPVKFNFKRLYLNIGPYVAYGLGGDYSLAGTGGDGKIEFGNTDYDGLQDGTVTFDNVLDYGAVIGVGIKIYKGLFTDVRYSYGFGNLNDKHPSIGFTDNKSQNRSLQFTIGYAIKLK